MAYSSRLLLNINLLFLHASTINTLVIQRQKVLAKCYQISLLIL